MIVTLALAGSVSFDGFEAPTKDFSPELGPPGFEEPAVEEPGIDPEEGAEDPFEDYEEREVWDGRIELVAVVDLDHIDVDTRAALELPGSGMVYVYKPADADIHNTFVRLDGHPPMMWDALASDPELHDAPPHAILTSEYWSQEIMRGLEVIAPGSPMPERSIVVDGDWASEDLRQASGDPEAPYYVITHAEQGLQGPFAAAPYGDMAVSVPVSGDPWADFVEYAQAPADYGSSVGYSWFMDMDPSGAWRHGSDLGEGWEYAAVWFANSPVE